MENYKAVGKVEMVLAEKLMFCCCFVESLDVLLKSVPFGLFVCLVHSLYQKPASFSTSVTPDSYRSSRAPRVISAIRDESVKGGNLHKGGEFPSC